MSSCNLRLAVSQTAEDEPSFYTITHPQRLSAHHPVGLLGCNAVGSDAATATGYLVPHRYHRSCILLQN